MPNFWVKANDETGGWGVQKLAGEGCLVVSGGHIAGVASPAGEPGAADLRLLPPAAPGASSSWTLLAGRDVSLRVNGLPLALGIRALRHRDEIAVAGQRCYFSTEELAQVLAFPGLAQTACCPRCKQRLEIGDLAVMCPHCNAWHHQSETYPCWTYGPTCALCQVQATALDAGFSWTPETL